MHGVQGVPSSNLGAPTNTYERSQKSGGPISGPICGKPPPTRRVPPRSYPLDWLTADLRRLPATLDFSVAGFLFERSAG